MVYNIEKIAETFNENKTYHNFCIEYSFRSLLPHLIGGSCLEVGCSYGGTTVKLAKYFKEVIAVDGSNIQINRLIEKLKLLNINNVTTCVSYIENLDINKKFDVIVASYILEHVKDPVFVLSHLKQFLNPNGTILITVPNARSLHRKIGAEMGLIKEITDLSSNDIDDGHYRVYTSDTLKQDIFLSGLKVISTEGIMLKPLTFVQMAEMGSNFCDACYKVGKEYSDICMSILIKVMNG